MHEKSAALALVCHAVSAESLPDAVSILKRDYPFAPAPVTKRQYGALESTRVFVRDGFRDRYTGERLIFPPVLRVLSSVLPVDFTFHPNWRTDVTHPAYWEVGATIDHVIPVTRGGADDESNWVTTSMARNSAKSNWTLGELGWSLLPGGNIAEWDGLLHWFIDYTARHPNTLSNGTIRQWHKAANLIASDLRQPRRDAR